jgi:hypothetical protein
LVVAEFGSSRHLPDCGFTREPFAPAVHFWAPVPLQPHNCTLVPSAVPLLEMSRHLPRSRSVLSPATVQSWA